MSKSIVNSFEAGQQHEFEIQFTCGQFSEEIRVMSQKKCVLSIGQCRPDQAAITHLLTTNYDVDVLTADLRQTANELLKQRTVDLVLVNRKLDADYSDGMEIIKDILGADLPQRPAVMLVSNFPEWQDKAVAMGALRGFGKAELNSAETRAKLSALLAGEGK
jgi:response regulator RpfG family c-di-GMP phosphodiesterase